MKKKHINVNIENQVDLFNEREASLTAEAALVLPMFLFGILFFLYFFQILYLQDSIQSSMTEAGKFISRYGKLTEEEETSDLAYRLLLRQRFFEYLDEETINKSCIVGGTAGISFLPSEIFKEDAEINIVAVYQIRFPIPFFGEKIMEIKQQVKTRAFVGKPMKNAKETADGNQKGEDEDFLVYITENASVYHKNENCTHLRLSIMEIEKSQLKTIRNENGGKYKACEKCIRGAEAEENVYVAKEGDRYHVSLSCSGLKRTVYTVEYSMVKDKRKCSRCG